jgi:acetylornithine deacetylase/succinyl-diaminopimelate desuccinylase-like protein
MMARGAEHGRLAYVAIDWTAVQAEALEVFREYLRIDTSNPPGNEGPAAHFLGDLLEAEGLEVEYIVAEEGRDIVVARLGASSAAPEGALMLGNHTDVVPVEREFWEHDPFAAEIVDNRVYGRGAVDMKGVGVMQLFAMILARREGLALNRDLLFVAVPDEEQGSEAGMAWLVEHRPDLVDVAFALNEGSSGQPDFGGKEARLFQIALTEKEMAPIKLTTVGTPGHGSRPHQDNSAVRLARAIGRLADWDRGIVITPETRDYLERLAAGGLIEDPDDIAAVTEAVAQSPDTLASFTNTLNVTVVNSGIKSNVIPARSEAILDCRLLPGQSRLEWEQEVRDYIDDPAIEVALQYPHERAQAVSEADTELYRVIESVIRDAVEDAVIVPGVSIVGTDNRFLRPLGIPSYGFIPCLLSQEERDGFHGNNEFLTIENFNMGLELMYEVVRRFCSDA